MKEFRNIIEALNYRTICPLCDSYLVINYELKTNNKNIFKIKNSGINFEFDIDNDIILTSIDTNYDYQKLNCNSQGHTILNIPIFVFCDKCMSYNYSFYINANFYNNRCNFKFGDEEIYYKQNNMNYNIIMFNNDNYMSVRINDGKSIKLPLITNRFYDKEFVINKIKTLIAFS